MAYCARVCCICGEPFWGWNSAKVCSHACKKVVWREYRLEYTKRPDVKEWAREYQKRPDVRKKRTERTTYLSFLGKRARVHMDYKVPEEWKKTIGDIKNQILDDCIKNPGKYLRDDEKKEERT